VLESKFKIKTTKMLEDGDAVAENILLGRHEEMTE
jgi:hypothetical protein